jgi:poly(A) polymerase
MTTVAVPTGPVWDAARAVARRLQAHGHQALVAGGAVRDLLLGRAVHDVDLTTDADPDRVVALFPRALTVGKAFGVVVVLQDDMPVEVATFRQDGAYTDGRRPDGVSFGTAVEDVQRRDLTINALLLDLDTGVITDHVGGIADLAAGVVRMVGDPVARIADDRLRILRCLRFAAVLGLRIDPPTWDALRRTPCVVSRERILQEWDKVTATGPTTTAAWWRLLVASNHLATVFPGPDDGRTAEALARAAPVPDAVAALCLLHAAPDRRGAWIAAQPMAATRQRQLSWITTHADDPAALLARSAADRARLLRDPWASALCTTIAARHPDAGASVQASLRAEQARGPIPRWITATELIARGHAPGPSIGRILRSIEDAWLAGRLTEAAEAWKLVPPPLPA